MYIVKLPRSIFPIWGVTDSNVTMLREILPALLVTSPI